MNNIDPFIAIRKQTRLAIPSNDTYLYRLGVALYGFNSINSFMIEIICYIDDRQSQVKLSSIESGRVLNTFRQTLQHIKSENLYPSIYSIMNEVDNSFERLNNERSDFVHSYPITNSKDEQILHRRKDSKRKYFEVDSEFLDDFISRLHDVSSLLYEIRRVVKPTL